MRVTIRTLTILGVDVLSWTTAEPDDAPAPDRGDCTTYPIGFTGPPSWEADPLLTE